MISEKSAGGKELLIKSLIKKGVLKTPSIIEAFAAVDRKDFAAPDYRELAYLDEALPIGYGQTISQPLTVAFMLELLEPKAGDKILDVGAGSGWTTALLAYAVRQKSGNSKLEARNPKQRQNYKFQKDGIIIGVERIPELVKFGRENLAKYNFTNARIVPAGEKLGFSEEAPYHRILVSAAGQEIPQELVDQFKVGGRLVMPVLNSIWRVDKISETETKKEEYYGFSFVPLVEN